MEDGEEGDLREVSPDEEVCEDEQGQERDGNQSGAEQGPEFSMSGKVGESFDGEEPGRIPDGSDRVGDGHGG